MNQKKFFLIHNPVPEETDPLEDILQLREKEAENFRQVLSKTEKQSPHDTIGT